MRNSDAAGLFREAAGTEVVGLKLGSRRTPQSSRVRDDLLFRNEIWPAHGRMHARNGTLSRRSKMSHHLAEDRSLCAAAAASAAAASAASAASSAAAAAAAASAASPLRAAAPSVERAQSPHVGSPWLPRAPALDAPGEDWAHAARGSAFAALSAGDAAKDAEEWARLVAEAEAEAGGGGALGIRGVDTFALLDLEDMLASNHRHAMHALQRRHAVAMAWTAAAHATMPHQVPRLADPGASPSAAAAAAAAAAEAASRVAASPRPETSPPHFAIAENDALGVAARLTTRSADP